MFVNGSEGGTRFGAKELVKLGWRFGCALRLVLAQALLLALDFGDEGGNALLNRSLNTIVDDVSRHSDVAIEQFAMDLLKVNSRRDTHRGKFTDLEFTQDEAREVRQRHLVGILLAKLHGTSLRRTRLGTLVLGAARLFARGFGAGPTTGLRVGVALVGGARLVLHRGDMGRTGTTTVHAIVFLSGRMNLGDHRPSVGRWTSLRLGLGPLRDTRLIRSSQSVTLDWRKELVLVRVMKVSTSRTKDRTARCYHVGIRGQIPGSTARSRGWGRRRTIIGEEEALTIAHGAIV